ncbi:ATP-binding protein [Streptomyces mayteni]
MTVPARIAKEQHAYGWALLARPQEIEAWRQRVTNVLRGWDAPPGAVELARLGVSELLSNVVKHVECPRCYLKVIRIGGEAVVQVFDYSSELPRIIAPDWDAESGRGLWMLRTMARRFGYEATCARRGKTVWFACGLNDDDAGVAW